MLECLESRLLLAAPPAPWVSLDIGSPSPAGSADLTGSTYTIKGGGSDIWGNSDQFQFLYEPMAGDGTIVARVASVQNTNGWAKAGLMIRNDLTAGAVNAAIFVTPGNGVSFQYRPTANNSTSNVQNSGLAAPYWVKLTRAGSTFTAYRSPDNVTWTSVSSQTLTMGTNVYVGLAVTSHSSGTLCTATFDNVSPPSILAPTGLTAAATSPYIVHLAWTNPATNATGFKIERSTSGGAYSQIALVGLTPTTYDDTTASPSTSYSYRVRATNGSTDSPYSNTASATTPALTIPAAPSNLSVTAVTSSRVDLAWTDNANSEQSFKIERSTDGVTYTLAGTAAMNAQSYSDTSVGDGTLYYYRVRASNTMGDSDPSNVVTATTPLPAPTLFDVVPTSPTSATLSWADNSSNETGFAVESSPDNIIFTPVATAPAGAVSYLATGLTEGTLLYYHVRAVSAATQSSWTASVPVTTFLATPTGLSATRQPSGAVALAWADNSDHETGYVVECSADSLTYAPIVTLGAGANSYTDTAAPATTAYYRVRATGASIVSAYSAIVSAAPIAAGGGVQGAYYNYDPNTKLFGSLILTRTDPTINFNWSGGSPDPAIPADNFAVRWSGQVQANYSETYTFYTTTDDGARLWVNGVQLVNKWQDQGSTEWSGTIALTAGQKYALVMEYYEHSGGASAKLSWSSPSQAKQIIPQSALFMPAGTNNAPAVNLVTPAAGANILTGATTLVADAVDADGTVARVDFYDGATLLGSSSAAPFAYAWTPTTAGSHSLTAVATDNAGGTGTSAAVSVNVLAAPIYINFQPSGSTIPAGYTPDYGKTYQAQNGYTYGWDVNLNDYPQPWKDANSSYSPDQRYDTWIEMKDTDSQGGARASWSIAVPNGAYDVHVVAGDASNTGVPEEVYVEGVLAFRGYTTAANRWFDVTVPAWVTDGKLTLSTTSTIAGKPIATDLCFVDITPADLPPTLTLSAPADASEFVQGTPITFTATASDNDGTVSKVEFYDGATLLGVDSNGLNGYSFTWSGAAAGVHTLNAIATDDADRTTTASATVRVTVPGDVAPTVAITSPANNQRYDTSSTVNITINATAGDTDGAITKVEFYRSDPFLGTVLVGTSTGSPYTATFSGAAPGTYTLWVRAWDNGYEITDSAPISVLVNANPTVTISNPVNGRTYSTVPATINLTASPADSDGTIAKVEFYRDNTLIGTVTDGTNGWTLPVAGLPAGTYNFKVIAYDNWGATASAGFNTVTVADRAGLLDTSSWLGGTGADYIKEAEIASDGTIIMAGTISDATPGGVTPILLNGATATTPGAILRLSSDGKTVLSVTRFCTDIGDMTLDASGNIYVAARTQGLFKLNPTATSILWQKLNIGDGVNNQGDGTADRLDVTRWTGASPDNGTVAVLRDAEEFAGTGGSKIVFVYDANGNYLGSVPSPYNRTYDIAIDGKTQSVYVTGFDQATGPSGNPVQISYIRSYSYTGTFKWKDYDWTGAQVDDPASGGTGPTNNMADTRGLRISVGRDGYLIALFNTAGGNHIFRYDPHDIWTAVNLASSDSYENFSNSASEHKTFFAKYDPATGDILKNADTTVIGKQLCARLPSTKANSLWGETSNIKTDEAGRIYFGAASSSYPPYTFNPVPDSEYGAGPTFIIYSSDAKTRLFVGRFNGSGYPSTIAAAVLPGHTYPNVVFGGYNNSTTPFNWTLNPLQAGFGGGTQDGFYAVSADMLLAPTPTIVDNADGSATVTITGSWSSQTSSSDYGANYLRDNTGDGTKSVKFTPTIPQAGTYEVYGWWVAGSDRASNVPIDIVYNGGSTTLTVNQQLNGGAWTLLGTYAFAAGSAGYVRIRNAGTGTGYVVADAVRFLPVSLDNLAPTITTPAAAAPNPVTGTTSALSVLASDDAGEAALTYTWSITSKPAGAADPTFSANATNAAKNTTATFTKAGSYNLLVTVCDAGGLTVTSPVNITVNQTLTAITVTPPATAPVPAATAQAFTAAARDQFGDPMAASFTWAASAGTIDAAGTLTTANTFGGPVSVTASAGGITSPAASLSVVPTRYEGTTGGDAFTLALNPDAITLRITAGATVYTIARSLMPPITIAPGDGQDTLTIDYTHGDPLPSGGLTFAAGLGTDTLNLIGASPADPFTFAAGSFTHAASGGPLTYGGLETLTLATGAYSIQDALNVVTLEARADATVTLNAVGGTSPDTHVFEHLTTVEDGSGINTHIVLGAGDPLGLGAGGTVMARVYAGGTAAGQKPTRAQTEALWFQVSTACAYGLGGITTSQITDASTNAVAMLQYDDALFGGPGATFNAVTEDIIGDVNGDFSVDGADLAILLQHYLTQPGTLPGEDGLNGSEHFTTYTWLEGDLNGDGAVDGADLAMLLKNYLTSYVPTNGSLQAQPAATLGLAPTLGVAPALGLAPTLSLAPALSPAAPAPDAQVTLVRLAKPPARRPNGSTLAPRDPAMPLALPTLDQVR